MFPISDKFRAFGWHVTEIDGHDMGIVAAFEKAESRETDHDRCHDGQGQGSSRFENKASYHGVAPNDEELRRSPHLSGVLED